jgi:hypothetical protein
VPLKRPLLLLQVNLMPPFNEGAQVVHRDTGEKGFVVFIDNEAIHVAFGAEPSERFEEFPLETAELARLQ